MATGVEANIFAALSSRLPTLVLNPALPIAWPNLQFPPDGVTKPKEYLEIFFLPNRTVTRTLSPGHQQHRGIFQVTVHHRDGAGMVKPLQFADQIIAHFPLGLILDQSGVRLKIYRKPYAIPQPPQNGSVTVPVTIEYETYQP
ncbi:MAG TPA: DUF4128 domain-containing protein [Pseudorhizobium sp.]|jgi:hypothetical protein|nr:DUF4128 domain-containing protein [Pseudorhizobium sp.]